MNIRTLLLSISLLVGPVASARPASPRPVRMTDADGRERLVRIVGNERHHYLEDAETGVRLEFDSLRRLVEAPHVAPEEAPRYDAPQRLLVYDSQGRSVYPASRGKYRFPVILVEFADTHFSISDPQHYYDRMFNLQGFSLDGHIGSVSDYFSDNSAGRFVPEFDVSRVVRLSQPSEYYVGTKRKSNFAEAVREALSAVDADIDFSLCDNDNDGSIDHLLVIFAGFGQADSGDPTRVWPHNDNYPYTTERHDGKLARSYSAGNELSYPDALPAGIGGPCYELARMLGVPDLSGDNTLTAATPGAFSLMDSGSYNGGGAIPPMLSSYERWVLRWLEYDDPLSQPGRYSVKAISEPDFRVVMLRPDNTSHEDVDEYYLVEARPDYKWDSALPEHGILFWHIAYNEFYWTYNWVNAYSSIRVHTVPSRPGAGMTAWPGGEAAYYWMDPTDPSLSKRFNRHTTGELPFPPAIGFISYDDASRTGYFTYDTQLEAPVEQIAVEGAERTEWEQQSVKIFWQPAPGEDVEYIIEVYRKGEKPGESIYLFPGDWRLTGRPEYVCRGFHKDEFDMEWTARIAPVRGLPSPLWSEPFTFIPSETSYNSGIDAPEAAAITPEYYTLDGLSVSAPTRPGLYIERRGPKTRKIIVR